MSKSCSKTKSPRTSRNSEVTSKSNSNSRNNNSKTKQSEEDKSFLMEAMPRGGGYLEVSPQLVNAQVEHPAGSGSRNSCTCGGDSDEGSDGSDGDQDWEEADEESLESYSGEDFNLLGNLITVVMLLASDNTPTEFQLNIAKDYLDCIKNTDGNAPPNVQGLLNHIQMVTEEEEEEEEGDEEVAEEAEEEEMVAAECPEACENEEENENESTEASDD